MKKALAVFVALLALGSAPAMAQATPPLLGYWKTSATCMAAEGAGFYHPTIKHQQKLDPMREVVLGHPTGGCFEMDLPDRLGGRGFVRIEAGREFVFDMNTGKPVRLAECNNHVYSWTPFSPLNTRGEKGEQGIAGPMGPIGPAGPQGPAGRDGFDGQDGKGASIGRIALISGIVSAVAIGTYALLHKDGDKKPGKPPGVTSDSAVVVAKCTATGTTNNCPPSPPSGSISAMRSAGIVLDPVRKRAGVRFSLPIRFAW